jgi:hypothetical protein
VAGEYHLSFLSSLRNVVIGKPLDPLNVKGREHLALAAFLAWVGLGADGLSSAAYGPQEAFLALGANSDLGLYLALATAVTGFMIALAYTTRSSNCSPRAAAIEVCVSKRKRPKEAGADPACWRLRGKSSNRQGTWQRALLRIGCEYRSWSAVP